MSKKTMENTLCGLTEEQVEKYMNSYDSLYELVFCTEWKDNKVVTSDLQCCSFCHVWHHKDDKSYYGKALLMATYVDNECDGYICSICYLNLIELCDEKNEMPKDEDEDED